MDQNEVWDNIASGWSGWRQYPYHLAIKYAHEWQPGGILDIGCGNGRNLLPFAKNKFDCYGVDFSKNMIKEATEYAKKNNIAVKLKVADARNLPFKDESFDYCISMATIHNIETEEGRLQALKEIRRVLKPGGQAIIGVWNRLQLIFLLRSPDLYEKWKKKNETLHRYYHMFTYWELKKLIERAGFQVVWSSGIFGKNIDFVVKIK